MKPRRVRTKSVVYSNAMQAATPLEVYASIEPNAYIPPTPPRGSRPDPPETHPTKRTRQPAHP